ncbi:MAG: hypothetical protein AB7Q01_16560 [Gammaproteobacteria bacterium]
MVGFDAIGQGEQIRPAEKALRVMLHMSPPGADVRGRADSKDPHIHSKDNRAAPRELVEDSNSERKSYGKDPPPQQASSPMTSTAGQVLL